MRKDVVVCARDVASGGVSVASSDIDVASG